MQESQYKLDTVSYICDTDEIGNKANCRFRDLGIAQINRTNLPRFKLNKSRLLSDLEYSVDAGALILASYRRFERREPKTWICRYNTGTGHYVDIELDCLNYKRQVDRYL
jgi:hypothetical protein